MLNLASLLPCASLFRTALGFSHRRAETAKAAIGQIAQDGAFVLASGATRGLFAAVNGVAKHLGHNRRPAKKVYLKSVRLFFRTRLRVDAFDIGFGIRIRSFSHESSNTKNFTLGGIRDRTTDFLYLVRAMPQPPGRVISTLAIFLCKRRSAKAQSTDHGTLSAT